jgi:uncharacterized phage-associated protein
MLIRLKTSARRSLSPDTNSYHVFRFRLNREKALAAAKYLLSKLNGKYNFTALLKLLFFADRYHIRQYIRPVTTDSYVAMPNGPVASFLYDVFKGSYPSIKDFVREGYDVHLQTEEKQFDELSESDIEALEFALTNFRKFNYSKLINISHEYPEWKRYAKRFDKEKDGHEPMFIEEFFGEPIASNKTFRLEKFVDPYPKISEEEKVELIDDVLDYSASVVPSEHDT